MDQFDRERRLYEELVDDYADRIHRVAWRMTGNSNDADDLVQETFEQAWKSIGRLRAPEAAFSWLLQIMRFRYAQMVKTRKRVPQVSLESAADSQETAANDKPVGNRLENAEILQKALDQLDQRFKLPLLLVFMEGLSAEEAARVLRIRRGTVLSRVHRAKQQLQPILARLGMTQDEIRSGSPTRY